MSSTTELPVHRGPRRSPSHQQPRAASRHGGRGPRAWWRRRSRLFRWLVLGSFVFFVLLCSAAVGVVYAATKIPLPDRVDSAQTSFITYADGTSEIVKLGSVNRTDVRLRAVSAEARSAMLAAEDRNFYHEPGISWRGIARALWANVRGREITQGGSTITQQYAKNAYLTQQRTFSRKIREIVLAVKLDRRYSKDQILELYLNTIYFGRGAYGIEAASRTYFGIPASRLTAEQGAVIAGLIRAPSTLDPRVSPRAAQRRWREVLDTMVRQGWLPAGRAAADRRMPVTLPRQAPDFRTGPQAAYIREQVKRELAAHGISENEINLGGLRIVTSLDRGRQFAAFRAVTATLQGAPPDLQTALAAVEPDTGRVLAWYGGSLYGRSRDGMERYVDNVSQAKIQPGSSFKPVVLAAALSKGIGLRSQYDGSDKVKLPGYESGVPNDEGGSPGWVDLPTATALSVNSVYVALGLDAGLDNVVRTGHELGITSPLYGYSSLSLGTEPVRPIEMAAVYGTFAAGGVAARPHLVDRVLDRGGRTRYKAANDRRRVLSPQVTADATYAMQQVVLRGTGRAAQLADGRPVAGKIGTTDGYRSAWFCGYDPHVAAVVAMFRGDGSNRAPKLRDLLGVHNVYGGTLPARV